MNEAHAERIAANEILVREVNELIVEKTTEMAGDGLEPGDQECGFLCACGRPGCTETLALTVEQFEAAHSEDDRFIVAPGHQVPEIEQVVERHDDYLVVKKKLGFKPDDVT